MSTNNIENLIEGVLRNGPEILDKCISNAPELKFYEDRIIKEFLDYPIPKKSFTGPEWLIPEEYQNMDIEEYLVNKCPEENYDRLVQELELYRKNNMIMVLKTIKYIIDTLRTNNVVWGVGRGSSVASYVLFLLGVHKIDSIKYNLPIEEFFKEIQNG